jgi:hypothetical protein
MGIVVRLLEGRFLALGLIQATCITIKDRQREEEQDQLTLNGVRFLQVLQGKKQKFRVMQDRGLG